LKAISSRGLSLDRFEVLDGAGAAEVEEVLAHAAVASAAALAPGEMGKPVLEAGVSARSCSPRHAPRASRTPSARPPVRPSQLCCSIASRHDAYEKRCYMRDPDGYLIEVGQTTAELH
jgi:catechol 2,3-dioxygenase-like lactoylglutathione lyase family enzyme